MCIFEEKLDDDVLEKLQDFEFAVSCNILLSFGLREAYSYFICICISGFHSSLMKIKTRRNFSIALQRHGNWITFLEMYTTKSWVSSLEVFIMNPTSKFLIAIFFLFPFSRHGESNYQRPCLAYSWILCPITQSCYFCGWAGLVSRFTFSGTFNFMAFFLQLPLVSCSVFWFLYDCSSSLSLALVARQNNYVRPILSSESVLDIRNGRFEQLCPISYALLVFICLEKRIWTFLFLAIRHVLQEMTVDTFIPNDTKIMDEGSFDKLSLLIWSVFSLLM